MKFLLLVYLIVVFNSLNAQKCSRNGLRSVFHSANETASSDTADILHTHIDLDMTDEEGDDLIAMASITFRPKLAVSKFSFELEGFTIDSIIMNNEFMSYSYASPVLLIDYGAELSTNEEYTVDIYYHGKPVQDPSGFGGWYVQDGYVYTMGVAFEADPHSYGRSWFPTFDNFVEKCTYSMDVLTKPGKIAYCSGVRTALDTLDGGQISTSWSLTTPVSAYLPNVAVANYVHMEDEYISFSGDTIPIWLISTPSDSVKMKSGFIHLKECLLAFEEAFGAYQWGKVGYHMVPFVGGAMEHAENISYPLYAIASNDESWEYLMAHELAHSWFGNWVTCASDQEMWINEGVASYCEAIFMEAVYGKERYKSYVKENHTEVVATAHLYDNGYLTISDVPHENVYGQHTYSKGSDLMHTLRSYMGDDEFFAGLKRVISNYGLANITSEQFRDELNKGSVDVSDFFDDWIFSPGFPVITVDSFKVEGSGPYDLTVYIHQSTVANPDLYSNIPMEVSVMSREGIISHHATIVNGELSVAQFTVNHFPHLVTMDMNELISQGITSDTLRISNGSTQLENTFLTLFVEGAQDDFVRMEKVWTAPSTSESQENVIATINRYWRFDGFLNEGFRAEGSFKVDARENSSFVQDQVLMDYFTSGYTEEDVHLLYRRGPGYDWISLGNTDISSLGSKTDGFFLVKGNFNLKGEYTVGIADATIGLGSINEEEGMFFPNPTNGLVHAKEKMDMNQISIYDIRGRKLELKFQGNAIDLSSYDNGIYIIERTEGNQRFTTEVQLVR